MTEMERMQYLHHRAVQGDVLTTEDETALRYWYAMLDRQEADINKQNYVIDVEAVREKVEKTNAQVIVVSTEVVTILKQNDVLRSENAALRYQLEHRFAQQTA
jgi:hypothetical protein